MMHQEITSSLFSIEAEQQLLGAILSDNRLFDQISGMIRAEHFYEPVHARIFKLAAARIEKDHLVSPVQMKADLANDEGLNQLGGPKYLVKLAGSAVASFAIRDYADMIRQMADRRMMAGRFKQISEEIEGGRDAGEAAAEVELFLHEREDQSDEPRTMSFLKAQTQSLQLMQQIYDGDLVAIPSGIEALDEVLSMAPGRYTILGGSTSMGKAQPLTSKILGVHGWKSMGAVKVGDRLASVDGSASVVTGVFPQGQKEIFRVTFSDGRVVRCCGEHLWQTYGPRRSQSRVMNTREISEKLKLPSQKGRLTVPLFSGEFGSDSDHPISPWLLGVFLGDGFMHGSNPKFSIADAELLWRVMEELSPEHELSKDQGYDYRVKAAKGGENKLAKALRGLGYHRCRSEDKFIPDAYMRGSRQSRAELLMGLLDSDGWVEKFGAVRYSTSSPQLAKQVQYLVRSLGGVCSIASRDPGYVHNGEKRIGQEHFTLNIRIQDAKKYISLTKKARRCNRVKPVTLTIVSVEPDGVEEAQCISVSHPSRLYVTDDFAVTHNTALALSISMAAMRAGFGVGFVSLEMSETDLVNRLNSMETKIPYKAYDRPMSENQFRKVVEAAKVLQALPLEIFSERVRDVPAILSEGKKLKRKMVPNGDFKGFKLLVVDYLQLVRAKGESQHVRLGEVANALKQVAKQLDVHVLALAQVSRDLGKEDHFMKARPRLADLRGSGDLEMAPDNVVFVFRPEYYLTRQTPPQKIEERADWEASLEQWKGKAEIIVAKARMGEICSVMAECDMATNQFRDVPDRQIEADF